MLRFEAGPGLSSSMAVSNVVFLYFYGLSFKSPSGVYVSVMPSMDLISDT